jgi:hypothetical protein
MLQFRGGFDCATDISQMGDADTQFALIYYGSRTGGNLMKKLTLLLLCLFLPVLSAVAQSFMRVAEVDNVLLEAQSADHCIETFRLTNNNSFIVTIKYRTISYASDGSTFPDSGSLYLNPGQSDSTEREYGAFTKCHVTRVSAELSVTPQR